MQLDQEKIMAILHADMSYYGSRKAVKRVDDRLTPYKSNFLPLCLTPSMRVLDLGCGSGYTLLQHSQLFQAGVGIDYDPSHIQMAHDARQESAVTNVDFFLMDFPGETGNFHNEPFDFVFSERGAIYPDSAESVQAALNLLRPDGLIFCEEIGEQHLKEVDLIFGDPSSRQTPGRLFDRIKDTMESCGVSVRLAADMYTKWYFPDVYEWLFWQCSLWTWLQIPLPEPDDPRIAQFVEKNTTASGEIGTTHHIVWVAGVKQ